MKGIDYLNFIADLYDIPADQRTADIGKYADTTPLTAKVVNSSPPTSSAAVNETVVIKQSLATTLAM